MAHLATDVLTRVHGALPEIRRWIDALVAEAEPKARPVDALRYGRLPEYFEGSVLQGARMLGVAKIPFPPVTAMGVPEFQAMSDMPMSGITFRHVFFALESQLNESLCFHELTSFSGKVLELMTFFSPTRPVSYSTATSRVRWRL